MLVRRCKFDKWLHFRLTDRAVVTAAEHSYAFTRVRNVALYIWYDLKKPFEKGFTSVAEARQWFLNIFFPIWCLTFAYIDVVRDVGDSLRCWRATRDVDADFLLIKSHQHNVEFQNIKILPPKSQNSPSLNHPLIFVTNIIVTNINVTTFTPNTLPVFQPHGQT